MNAWAYAGAIVLLVGVQALALFFFHHPAICACGYIKAWEGAVLSSGNSQHLTDWYTLSHVIHGLLFYLLLSLFFPRMHILSRLLIAVGVEAAWEIAENTPWVIERYRQQALAAGYTGDSILNSISDTFAMVAGFFLARRLPVSAAVFLGVSLEIIAGASIRDNFTLNVLNLIHQFPSISAWQAGIR